MNMTSRSRQVRIRIEHCLRRLITGRNTLLQVEVLSETEIMIPDTMRRLAKGIEELKDFLVSACVDCSKPAHCSLLSVAHRSLATYQLTTSPHVQAVNGDEASLVGTETVEVARKLLAELAPEDCSAAGGDDDRI